MEDISKQSKCQEYGGNMAEKYDGWVAKDKFGFFWYGTFETNKKATMSHIKEDWQKRYEFKIVKVKFVEVK